MGNFNTNKYQLNNSSMSTKKSHSIFSGLSCNILGKKHKKVKCGEPLKSKSLSFDESETLKSINAKSEIQNDVFHEIKLSESLNKNSTNSCNSLSDDLNETINLNDDEIKLKNEAMFSAVNTTCPREVLDKSLVNFSSSQSVIYENNSKENSINYNPNYSESYKSYLCRKNRYISSPRTCIDHFNLSNYYVKWDFLEKNYKSQNGIIDKRICVNKSVTSDSGENYSLNDQVSHSYPRLSESSLNSDDLMLGTDVNLDQADDDVSKDYNTSEKDDPFIFENIKNNKKEPAKIVNTSTSLLSNSIDAIADESERNDIVSFDSSRESSVSIQRKNFNKGFSLRPHSFSSPLRPSPRESKPFGKRNSNLSTVESVDLAWTWISTSETANLSQDVSNLKLMLLKMKRLLLDETYNENFLSNSRIDTFNVTGVSSVFSEPSTPNCNNNILDPSQIDSFMSQNRPWETMTKEMLIQELHDLSQQNGDLQYQLKEKSRIIEFLQDQQQNYRNYPRRLHSTSSKTEISSRRITRSSTFETASTLNNQAFSQDPEFSFSNSHDTKIIQSESK